MQDFDTDNSKKKKNILNYNDVVILFFSIKKYNEKLFANFIIKIIFVINTCLKNGMSNVTDLCRNPVSYMKSGLYVISHKRNDIFFIYK